jgi:signal peptidase I
MMIIMPKGKKTRIEEEKRVKKPNKLGLWPEYIAILLLLIIYAFFNNFYIGVILFFLIVGTVAMELRQGVKEEGGKNTVRDLAVVVVVVIIVMFVVLPLLFGTSGVPISTVASCSMLPTLQRGDLVVLHGISNMSQFAAQHHIPVVNVSRASFDRMVANMQSEFIAFYPYFNSNESDVQVSGIVGNESYNIALYSVPCVYRYEYLGEDYLVSRCVLPSSYQNDNLIKYNYSIGNVSLSGRQYHIVYTSGIQINGTRIAENYSNPIIVYEPTPNDSFYDVGGFIIHRAIAEINVNGTYYTITKGDNNAEFDIQAENYPVNQNKVFGYELVDVPVVGYLSLILKGDVASVQGCNQTIER